MSRFASTRVIIMNMWTCVMLFLMSLSSCDAQEQSMCQICANTGYCDQAFHNGPGQFCGNWKDQHSYTTSGNMMVKPCCCPLDYQCKVSQFACLCHKPENGGYHDNNSINTNHPYRPHKELPHHGSSHDTFIRVFGIIVLIGIICCFCILCFCRNDSDVGTRGGYYEPVGVTTSTPPAYNPAYEPVAYPVTPVPVPTYGATAGGDGGFASSFMGGALGGLFSGALSGALAGNVTGRRVGDGEEAYNGQGNYGGAGDRYDIQGDSGGGVGGWDIAGDSGGGGGGWDIAGDSGDGGDIQGDS